MKTHYTLSPLRLARLSAGLRQSDLAKDIGRSTAFVCRLERGGYARLTPEIAEQLGATLDIPPVIIFRGRETR